MIVITVHKNGQLSLNYFQRRKETLGRESTMISPAHQAIKSSGACYQIRLQRYHSIKKKQATLWPSLTQIFKMMRNL